MTKAIVLEKAQICSEVPDVIPFENLFLRVCQARIFFGPEQHKEDRKNQEGAEDQREQSLRILVEETLKPRPQICEHGTPLVIDLNGRGCNEHQLFLQHHAAEKLTLDHTDYTQKSQGNTQAQKEQYCLAKERTICYTLPINL